jgi:diaminohydroxyphosphoribosylaminopyrimidine deaminase / 5-amino-6-(5-phosphoribosylamino)uracil reductase
MSRDEKWMRRVFELARRGAGFAHPNPLVGAVLLRGGRVVGEGYHKHYGEAHAEANALLRAGGRARGATLYLNLEPCSHWGNTPPCAEALVRAGVREVVAAMRDPNPKVAGRGFRLLKRHGLRVRTGTLEAEAKFLNRAFMTYITRRRPFVTLKAATSLDGKTATHAGESRWITGEPARRAGHAFRAEVDAIAVGAGTVLKDNPHLTSHGNGRSPLRVIFDSRLRTPPDARILSRDAPTLLFCGAQAPTVKRKSLERKGAEVISLRRSSGGLNVDEALRALPRKGVAHLMIEGGGTLAASFLEARGIDEVLWFIAPKLIGGAEARTALEGSGVSRLSQAARVEDWRVESVGEDLCIRGAVRY